MGQPLAKLQLHPPAKILGEFPPPLQIFFRYNGVDSNYGKLAVAEYANLHQPSFVAGFACEVVHFAAGRGLCLTADRGVFTTYTAQLFDSSFERLSTFPLQGIPSRCRISPNGKRAAITVFVSGHSYSSIDFSTQTLLIDTERAEVLANLEDFAVTLDERPFLSPDFNFWGVTFTPDSKRFYCTLASKGKTYLVAGDITARTASVIHKNVECPSVSPGGTRIAYNKRVIVDGKITWQLHILDLTTKQETPLLEKLSVDDQLEWLDNSSVLYALPDNPTKSSASTNVWLADADGKNPPELFLSKAYSPAVVRGGN